MKVYAISDLHLPFSTNKPMEIFGRAWDNYLQKIKEDWKNKVSEKDIVLIAGDISWAMKLEDFQTDLDFFDDLPGKIVMIRGNHDYWWTTVTSMRKFLKENKFQNIDFLYNNSFELSIPITDVASFTSFSKIFFGKGGGTDSSARENAA